MNIAQLEEDKEAKEELDALEKLAREHEFVRSFHDIAKVCWQNAEDKGFHKRERTFAEEIALMHSELSEALEGNRHGSHPSEHIPEYSAEEEELADVIIRIFDTCISRKFRVAQAVLAKMEYNASREYMHGKKF